MIVTTTDLIQGAIIESYLGIVTTEVVYASNFIRDFFPSLRDIMGGRTGSYERLFEQGQRKAIEELEKRPEGLGADAVMLKSSDH